MEVLWCFFLLAVPALARDITDEEYARFPRLYHLDDYEHCLSQSGGLYCLGTFHITPLKEPNPVYNLMKEYSLDPHHFNRTQLHRGYCVSTRCPSLSSERNASLRFERCASQWARRRSLRTTLLKLNYCRTHAQEFASKHNPEPLDIPQKVFLVVLAVIVALNTVGTVYDVYTGDNEKKNSLLMQWSVRYNWRRLTANYEDGDSRLAALAPLQGIRVFLMLLIMATHSGCIHDMLYLYNPRWIEQISRHPVLMIFLNGTSVVQVFVMLSNFLLAYNLLLYAKNHQISYKLMPFITIKRIARISPVYLLAVGFAGTWWSRMGSGPMWGVVRDESHICRNKFWIHAAYLNNLVQPEDICLVQTWFLAVDMQLYLLSSVLTLFLVQRRHSAQRLLAVLVVLSSLLNGALAYVFDWKSIMYFAYPSKLATMYRGVPSFPWLYQSPWGSLPAALLGLLLAFLHYDLQERGIKLTDYKWVYIPYKLAPLCMVWWILWGNSLREYTAPRVVATYVSLERPVLSALAAIFVLGAINGLKGAVWRVWSWRGWQTSGRLSLCVLLLHWSVNMTLAAQRPQTLHTSLLTVVVDWLATSCFSYMLAVPLTIMVEMPMQKSIMSLVLSSAIKQSTPTESDRSLKKCQ